MKEYKFKKRTPQKESAVSRDAIPLSSLFLALRALVRNVPDAVVQFYLCLWSAARASVALIKPPIVGAPRAATDEPCARMGTAPDDSDASDDMGCDAPLHAAALTAPPPHSHVINCTLRACSSLYSIQNMEQFCLFVSCVIKWMLCVCYKRLFLSSLICGCVNIYNSA